MCKLFGVSRQCYYQNLARQIKNEKEHEVIVNLTKRIRRQHKHMGGKKVYGKLKKDIAKSGIKCGRDKYLMILKEHCLLVKRPKMYVKTTQSQHVHRKYPNIIRDLDIRRSEQVFVSDITYIKTMQGFMYLYLTTDVYSKQIMGWELSDNLKTVNANKALKMAIKNRRYPKRELIHHSDRGLQYCHPTYIDILNRNKIKISMTDKYDPYENAVAERVNGILKSEYDIGGEFVGLKDAAMEIRHAIWLYNNDRPHLSCHSMVPVEAHKEENYKLKRWSKNFSIKGYPLIENKISLNENY